MNITQRMHCVIDHENTIESLYSFKDFPIKITCTDNLDPKTDQLADMNWGVSEKGHIQLIDLLDPDIIYANYHTTGLVGNIWKEHHKKLFEFIYI